MLFSLLIFISGCSSDIALEPDNKEETGSTILRLEINKEMLTRGMITSTNFQEGDELLVRLIDTHFDSWGIPILNCKATYINGVWELDTLIDVTKPYTNKYLSNTESSEFPDRISVEVAYPYDKVSLPTKGLGARFACDDVLSQTDILIGRCVVDKKDPIAKITCGHYLTCLSFDVKNDTDRPIVVDSLTVSQKLMKTYYDDRVFTFLPQSVQIGADDQEYKELNVYENFREKVTYQYNIEIMPGEKKSVNFMLNPTKWIYEYYDWRKNDITLEPLKFELSVNGEPVRFDIQPASWNSSQNYVYPVTYKGHSEPTPEFDEYVDLGLSVLWASCNVGAISPEEIGKYFYWGDIRGYVPGEFYIEETFNSVVRASLAELIDSKIVTENINHKYEYSKYCLTPEFDAATQNMGLPWRMPTTEELEELIDNTDWEWYKKGEDWIFKLTSTVPGYKEKYILLAGQVGRFDNKIGYGLVAESNFTDKDTYAGAWRSSTLPTEDEKFILGSRVLLLNWNKDENLKYDNLTREVNTIAQYMGVPIRAVRPKK